MPTISNPSGLSQKVLLKLERIARLRLFSKLTDKVIADTLGISQSNLSQIVALPEYIEVSERLINGEITKMDEAIASSTDAMHSHFQTAVPAAMRTLVEACLQRRDMRVAIQAADSLLDRDPRQAFAKRSKASSLEAALAVALPPSVLAGAVAVNNSTASAKPGVPPPKPIMPVDKHVN